MSSNPQRREFRAFRPSSEALEGRALLSNVVTGTDIDGDKWVLRLIGPGNVRVTNQLDSSGNAVPLGNPGLIDSIEIAGTDPLSSHLVGTVQKASGGDGKVFFQNMGQFGGLAVNVTGSVGIHVVDMPDFWLAHTSTTRPTAGTSAAEIQMIDGVNNLRFGGVDASYTPPGGTPLNQNGQNDQLLVRLGLPWSQGTSIIIDKSISTAQAATSSTTSATQDGVEFHVFGRINQFQANNIIGDPTIDSGQFTGDGGTLVISSNASEPNAISHGELTASVNGQIGYFRVGNNARNLSVQTDTRISNFYIGGETNNVFVLAPTSLRHALFGLGMDTVNLRLRACSCSRPIEAPSARP